MIPGVKAAWWDVEAVLALPWKRRPECIEIHLGRHDCYRDRPKVVAAFAGRAAEMTLAVHQPFVLETGEPVDVAALDPATRRASLATWSAAAELACDVGADFLILHPGGIRRGSEPDADARSLREALDALESPVPILLENMPQWDHTVPEHSGRCTLGRTPGELLLFDEQVAGFCLDTSHAWGSHLPGRPEHVLAFLPLASRIFHVHAGDSAAPDLEGLPLGAGTIGREPFLALAKALGARVACVPEIDGMEKELDAARGAIDWLDALGAFGAAPLGVGATSPARDSRHAG
ncbi:MAG: sugar phosphate isomerase/epimerase family protein [Thermoplasmatota archaeon]